MYEDHPATGCLPLPSLHMPTTAGDIIAHATQIDANLWNDQRGKHKAWTAAAESCPHLPPGGVHAVWQILAAWRSMLLAAAAHIQGHKQTVGIAECQASLVARLDDLDRLVCHHTEPDDDGDLFGPLIDRCTARSCWTTAI